MLCLATICHASEIEKISGTHLLDSYAKKLARPGQRTPSKRVPASKIGDRQTFKTFNFATNEWEETRAILTASGKNVYLYLEAGRSFEAAKQQRLISEFDEKIYPVTTRYFGHEARPGIDNDERITILLMDIRDNFSESGTYTSGYFNRGDCYLPGEIPEDVNLQSNCREMLYIDINPSDTESTEFFATIAHEFQHLIHFYHDSEEYDWLNEGCSQISTWLCGYGHPRQIEAYQQTPDNSLVAWAPWNQVANYGQVYLWCYYVMNKFCGSDAERIEFFRALVDDQAKGMASFAKQFKESGADFAGVFTDFCIACFVNRPGLEPSVYSLGEDLNEYQLPATAFFDRLPLMYRNSVSIWGADLVKVKLGNDMKKLRVDFAGDLNNLPNSFTVALVFVSDATGSVDSVEFIENIESTTRNVARVMLPGANDDYPAPMPVKTQMGHLITSVPANSDSLYLVIIGKAPEDLGDSALAWAGKATYRVDVQCVENEVVAAAPQGSSRLDAHLLLNNYLKLRNRVDDFSGHENLVALTSEIKSLLKSELSSEDQPMLEAIQREPNCEELKKLVAELRKFSQLHR